MVIIWSTKDRCKMFRVIFYGGMSSHSKEAFWSQYGSLTGQYFICNVSIFNGRNIAFDLFRFVCVARNKQCHMVPILCLFLSFVHTRSRLKWLWKESSFDIVGKYYDKYFVLFSRRPGLSTDITDITVVVMDWKNIKEKIQQIVFAAISFGLFSVSCWFYRCNHLLCRGSTSGIRVIADLLSSWRHSMEQKI